MKKKRLAPPQKKAATQKRAAVEHAHESQTTYTVDEAKQLIYLFTQECCAQLKELEQYMRDTLNGVKRDFRPTK